MASQGDSKVKQLTTPISEEQIRSLHQGEMISLTGIVVTARDVAHKYIVDNFIRNNPQDTEPEMYEVLKKYLTEGVIYHCGPVVKKTDEGYKMVAAGPTTSIRQETYTADVMKLFSIRGVIGKGGMKEKTQAGLAESGGVYLHAVGGAAPYIADRIVKVVEVFKKEEFGVPEAFWVLEVKDLELFVTMDSHGQSFHNTIQEKSKERLNALIS
jgi:fumarate hydratase subunit beta